MEIINKIDGIKSQIPIQLEYYIGLNTMIFSKPRTSFENIVSIELIVKDVQGWDVMVVTNSTGFKYMYKGKWNDGFMPQNES
jgi:hypothetical protein